MNSQKYDIRSIREYLLGSLSDIEAENFDELSIADDDFAALLDSVENDLVDSYVSNDLTSNELAKFKSHYLATARRRDKVRFAEAFHNLSEHGAVKPVAFAAPVVEKRRSFFDIFSKPILGWGFAAATLVLAFLSGSFFLENARLRNQITNSASSTNTAVVRERDLERQIADLRQNGDQANQNLAQLTDERQRLEQELEDAKADVRAAEQRQKQEANQRPAISVGGAPTIASFVLAAPVRGSGQLQHLTIPPSVSRVALQLALEPNDFTNFRAVLKDQTTGRTVWSSGVVKATKGNGNGSLNLSIPGRMLSPTVYTITLSGVSGANTQETISDYTFQVVR